MATNPFDDLGGGPIAGAQPLPNPFDDLTPPVEQKTSKPDEQPSWMHEIGRGAGLVGRAATNVVTAAPLMAMDAGVASRNLIGNAINSATGQPKTRDFVLPSAGWKDWMDQHFGTPQTTAEKVADVAAPIAMGGIAGASKIPSQLLKAVAGNPTLGNAMGGAGGAATPLAEGLALPSGNRARAVAGVLDKSSDLGLVVPPSTSNPSVKNWALETLGGKTATQQMASGKNNDLAQAIIARSLKQNPDAPINPASLAAIRATAGDDYKAARGAGTIFTDGDYQNLVDGVRQQFQGKAGSFPGSKPPAILDDLDSLDVGHFDASHAIDKIDELRDKASAAFKAGEGTTGTAYRKLSKGLEDQIASGLEAKGGDPNIVKNFRDSRKLIAQTHTVEDAMTPGSNDVSIRDLANALNRGVPLEGDMRTLGEFGAAFPKASQPVSALGSQGINHTDSIGPMVGALGEGLPMWARIGAAGAPLARYGARRYLLSDMGQAGAVPKGAKTSEPPNALAAALAKSLQAAQGQ